MWLYYMWSGRPVAGSAVPAETALLFIWGAVAGILVSVIDFFAMQNGTAGIYGFFPEFLFSFLGETLVPVAAAVLLVNLLSKGSVHDRLLSPASVLFGFFSIFLAYKLLSGYKTYSPMLLFVKPLLYASMIFLVDILCRYMDRSVRNEDAPWVYVLYGLGLLAALACPGILFTFWLLAYPVWTWAVFSALYIALPVCVRLIAALFFTD